MYPTPDCVVCGKRVTTYGWRPWPVLCEEHMQEASKRIEPIVVEAADKIVSDLKGEYAKANS